MLLRPFLNDATSCASYLFGCGTYAKLAVVDPHAELVDGYLANATALGAPIVARGTVDPVGFINSIPLQMCRNRTRDRVCERYGASRRGPHPAHHQRAYRLCASRSSANARR
jgi:hypothetical protein